MTKLPALRRNLVYQVGTIRSLLTGVYEGDLRFDELAHYGDFGLGTFDGVNGEMVALDGEYFRIDALGCAHRVDPEMKSPFAIITRFHGTDALTLHDPLDFAGLKSRIHSRFESDNIIYAVRIHGKFDQVDARSEHPQPEGHRPLSETIAQVQTQLCYKDIEGTMAGFWFPQHMKAINVPGFHFHFLADNRTVGGHVFDLKLRKVKVEVMPVFDFGMHLLHTPLFEHADLSFESDAATRQVEQTPQAKQAVEM